GAPPQEDEVQNLGRQVLRLCPLRVDKLVDRVERDVDRRVAESLHNPLLVPRQLGPHTRPPRAGPVPQPVDGGVVPLPVFRGGDAPPPQTSLRLGFALVVWGVVRLLRVLSL